MQDLTQSRLKEIVSYNSDTGEFTWLNHGNGRRLNYAKSRPGFPRSGTKMNTGYINITIDQQHYLAHRLAWLYMNGGWPGSEIDHINHIRDDNRLCNLREVNRGGNCRNVPRGRANKSGFTGVHWYARKRKWIAQARGKGKTVHLGSFDTIIEAVAARIRANKEYGYHDNHGA